MPPPSTIRLPGPRLTDFRSLPGLAGFAMDLFTQLFGGLLAFVYHCFDRIVIYGYLSGLSRPERVVNFFHQVVGVPVVSREILSQRTADYQNWVEAFARNHRIPIEWAEKSVRKEDYVLPWQRRMVRADSYGVYYILKSMEQGPTFRVTVPKYPTKDANYRILARQRSRFTHYYFYIRDETLGPMVMRIASFLPFQTTYYLNGHSFIEQELNRAGIGFRKTDNAFLAVDDVAALQAAADRLSPEIIRQRLDYWTLILGPKFSAKERIRLNLSLLRHRLDRILPQLHLQAALSYLQTVRTQLRARSVAAHRRQDRRHLRHPGEPQDAWQTRHHHRPRRARPPCLPCLFQARLPQTIRKVRHLPAQRAGLKQPRRFSSQEGTGSSQCRARAVPNHHRSLRQLPGAMAQRPCRLPAAA